MDSLEDNLLKLEHSLLKILLKDKTTKKNILWCTRDYEDNGQGFRESDEIRAEYLVGKFLVVIQPRSSKTKEIQTMRIRSRAEVFTPSWICNEQNNLVDSAWFGRENVFNIPNGTSWITTQTKIEFNKKTWKKYIDAKRLEITCGEAPYLVSRYDTTNGVLIPINERIGLFDRKMRIVNENCETDEEWLKWSIRSVQSIYGYDFQGDNVLIARENVLYSYIDYYKDRFNREPDYKLLKKIANVISWNIWQMDGITMTAPFSECLKQKSQINMLEILGENEILGKDLLYCRIFDWRSKNSLEFRSMINKRE